MMAKMLLNLSSSESDSEPDPYAYLKDDEFTSEKYKIHLQGLPKYYGIAELKTFLNEKLKLNYCKIKVPGKGCNWVFVCFENEENRNKAIETLNGITWKNSKLKVQIAKPLPDPFLKQKLIIDRGSTRSNGLDDDDDNRLAPDIKIKHATIPLWQMPYPKQLIWKQTEMTNVMKKLSKQMLKEEKGDLLKWLKPQRIKYNGMPCELLPILSADVNIEYRNKCEFTIGKGPNNKVSIGFRLASYVAGSVHVGPVDDLCHIPSKMKKVVRIFEEFVHNSDIPPFDPVTRRGYWTQLTARTTSGDDLMVIVVIQGRHLKAEMLEELKKQLQDFFETGKGADAGVTSLYLQTVVKKRRKMPDECKDTYHHLSGKAHIEETLLGMKFRISPQAFFQVNTLGAEVLYKAAIDLVKPTAETALLDVCCGTGTIGLAFSKHCGEVFGLDEVEDGIKDARENMVANGVTNCEFFVGKAEDILSPVIQRTTMPDVVAVVDPPRAGLGVAALLALRRAKNLSRLVYISCDPEAAAGNLLSLARPTSKKYLGEPFVPVKAIPVDMFPHTKHCELVILLERQSAASAATKSCDLA